MASRAPRWRQAQAAEPQPPPGGQGLTGLPDKDTERRFKALRWEQPPDIEAWRKEVETVRRTGFGIDRGNDISGIAVARSRWSTSRAG
jgi:hypothetical protein